MYKNHDSALKHQTRLEVLDKAEEIINLQGEIKVLSLSSSNFIFERVLLKRNPGKVKLDCVEREKDSYKQALKKAGRKENVRLFMDDVFHYIQSSSERYDLIWLDLCGPLSLKTLSNLLEVVRLPILESTSYLFITLLAGREPECKSLEEFYGVDIKTIRNHIFPNVLAEYAGKAGRKCQIDPIIHYKSELSEVRSPMNVYGFSFK